MEDFRALVCASGPALRALRDAVAAAGATSIETTPDGFRALELSEQISPAIIVVSPDTAKSLSGHDLIARLATTAPTVPIVIESMDGRAAARCLAAGAVAGSLAAESEGVLVGVIRQTLETGAGISPGLLRAILGHLVQGERREREWTKALAGVAVQVEEGKKAKAEFIANVSHELRTPLTVIKGVASLLQSSSLDEDTRADLAERSEGAADRLSRMVNDLISLSELEQGDTEVSPVRCDLAPVVSDAALETSAGYHGLDLLLELPRSLPALADARLIGVVVRHLVDNACKYSKTGGRVTVKGRAAPEGAMVTVSDQGEGMDRALAQSAFGEAFVAGEEILRKERAGLGVGLHLARQIVVAHGGIIWADPLPSGGTRVGFVLPSGADEL